MKKLFVLWAVNALSLWIVSEMLSSISFEGTTPLVMTALVLTVLNGTLKPVLKFLSFPITLMTLGLFSFVINAMILQFAFAMTSGAGMEGFWTAMIAGFGLSVINRILSGYFDKD
jgi:putative membrane protein